MSAMRHSDGGTPRPETDRELLAAAGSVVESSPLVIGVNPTTVPRDLAAVHGGAPDQPDGLRNKRDSLPAEGPRRSAIEFAKTHYKTVALVRHGIRCGKPTCRCATSEHRHGPYAYLYWRNAAGRAERIYVPKSELAHVQEIIAVRRAIDRLRRQVVADTRDYLRFLRQLNKEYGP